MNFITVCGRSGQFARIGAFRIEEEFEQVLQFSFFIENCVLQAGKVLYQLMETFAHCLSIDFHCFNIIA